MPAKRPSVTATTARATSVPAATTTPAPDTVMRPATPQTARLSASRLRSSGGVMPIAYAMSTARLRISSGTSRLIQAPPRASSTNFSFSTTTLPRRMVMDGQAFTSRPSQGV